jgi:hypothetical protein
MYAQYYEYRFVDIYMYWHLSAPNVWHVACVPFPAILAQPPAPPYKFRISASTEAKYEVPDRGIKSTLA